MDYITFNVIASTGSRHRMKKIFIMENTVHLCKKRQFLPEFLKCIVISSSVASMRERVRDCRRRERGKRGGGKRSTGEMPIQN